MKIQEFHASWDEVFQMADAFMSGKPVGWVAVAANERGREGIQAVFPEANIAWRDPGEGWPDDFQGFSFNIPDMASYMRHHLPLEITGGLALDDASPKSLAYLFARAVANKGARTAFERGDGGYDFVQGDQN
jgi:hypothetical protein